MEKRSKPQPQAESSTPPDSALARAHDAHLSPPQRRAIEKLTAGDTVIDAAKAAGVTRSTLHRWLKDNPHFAAAYNAWQEESIAIARGRLVALTGDAVGAVATAIRAGDSRAALAILKSMGLLDRPTPGSTDPAVVARDQENQAMREVQRQMRESTDF